MCVASIAYRAHPDWLLVAIANRDEFHARPAAALHQWDNGILAGRDLEAGGTWLGVSPQGRFALVTNRRVENGTGPAGLSRGELVPAWLKGARQGDHREMSPFSLFLADREGLRFATNHPEPSLGALPNGIHGLSNGPIAPPWSKTLALGGALERWLQAGDSTFDALFATLGQTEPLPGPGPDDPFSSVMIRNSQYGTRCSTVVAIDAAGNGRIAERSFDPQGNQTGAVAFEFAWG